MIQLREYRNTDVVSFYEAVKESIPQLSPWMPWCHQEYSLQEAKEWVLNLVPTLWESKTGYEFVISNDQDQLLGGIGLENIQLTKDQADIGYWVRSSEIDKGVATEACRLILKFGFSELTLRSIRIISSVDNQKSIRIPEKLNFDNKEIVTNGFRIGDKISNAAVYYFYNEIN